MFSDFIHVVSKTTLPSGLPHPDKIQLPTLSPALHIALSSGEKNSSIFNQVLKECEIFYSATYPGMADSSYYQMIGKKMVSKYSCLGFADGTNPWVSVWRHYFFFKNFILTEKNKIYNNNCFLHPFFCLSVRCFFIIIGFKYNLFRWT